MRISINDILVSSKHRFEYSCEFDLSCYEMEGRKIIFNSKPLVKVEILKENDENLYANCNIHLDAKLNCVRCLEEMQAIEDVNISGLISKQDSQDEYDVILIEDDYFDVEKVLYDAIFEFLNNELYCEDDCDGLCPYCGVNLNNTSCNCDKDVLNVDPRLEQLKNFLDN